MATKKKSASRTARSSENRPAAEAATPPKLSRERPFYEEATSPSKLWQDKRRDLLGLDPDELKQRLEAELSSLGDDCVQKREALARALRATVAELGDVDERIAAVRFRDELSNLLDALRQCPGLVSAAAVRLQEIEHGASVAPRFARSGRVLWPAVGRSDGRPVGALGRGSLADVQPRLAIARMLTTLSSDVAKERDRLTADSAADPLLGVGKNGGQNPEELVTTLAELLCDAGYSRSEASKLLLGKEVKQRLARRRKTAAELTERMETVAKRIRRRKARKRGV